MQENVKDVFISYKAEEYDEAVNVKKRLEKEGISCWLAPGSIPGGSSYAVQIPKAIRECTAFVLILSKKAQESKWVPRELDQAINGGKTVLPFMIENCPLNDEFSFYLANVQRYNAWEDRNEAFDGMIREIRALLAEKRARESYTDAVLPDGEIRVPGQDNAETGKPDGVPGSLRVLPSGEVQVVGAGEDNSLVSGNAQGSLLPAADGQGDFAVQGGGPSRRKGGRRAGRSAASGPEKQKKKGNKNKRLLIAVNKRLLMQNLIMTKIPHCMIKEHLVMIFLKISLVMIWIIRIRFSILFLLTSFLHLLFDIVFNILH